MLCTYERIFDQEIGKPGGILMIISFLFDLNRKYHEPKYTNYHKYQVSDVYKMKSMLIQS